jgi:hypothetical protein
MKPNTLERFLTRREVNYEKLTKSDRSLLISQTAVELARESAQRVSHCERRLDTIEPVIQVVYALSQVLRMVERLPLPTDLIGKSENGD